MANSDIIKIGFDYRASLAQFEKETNGVFDGISNKAGKQRITIQLDAKDDKVIDKIKELQKLKLDKFTFEFGDSGLKEQLQTFDKLENKINEIINLGKGKSFIDSSPTVTDIGKIENKINELNKKYEEAQKKLSSIGSGDISGKDVNLVDNAEFQKLTQEVSKLKNQFDDLKIHIQLLDDCTVPTDRFFELQSQVEGATARVSDLVDEFTKLSNAQKVLSSTPQESNISSGSDSAIEQQNKFQEELKETQRQAEQTANSVNSISNSNSPIRDYWKKYGTSNRDSYITNKSNVTYDTIVRQLTEEENASKGIMRQISKFIDPSNIMQGIDTDYFKAVDQELQKIGYHLDAIQINEKDHIASAKILPIDDKAITNAEEMERILKNIQSSTTSQNPMNDAFPNTDTKLDEAVTSAKDLDKTLKQVDIPTDSFDKVLEKLDRTKSELVDIVKITKQSVSDADGKFHDSYTLKDSRGSTEIYGVNSKTDKGQILRQNIVGYDKKKDELENAKNIKAEWDKNLKAIQDYMDAVTKLNNLKAKDKGTGSEANQIALQTQNVEELKQAAWDARKNLSSMQAENPDIIAWKQWVDMMELFDQASKGSAESAAKLKDALNNIKVPSLDKYENKLSSYLNKTGGYDATIARFNDGGWTSDTYLKNVQAVKNAVKEYETLLDNIKTNQNGIASDEDIQNLDKYEKKIKDTIATVTNMSAAEKGYGQLAGQKEIDKINKILRENSAMSSEAKAKIKAYKQELISGNPSVSLGKIHGEIMKIVNAEELAGRASRSMFDVIKEKAFYGFAAQIGMYFGFNDIVNGFKQAASTVTELNTQITELAKVSEQSSKQIYADFDSYADIAKEVRGTISDTIVATADWSKNGYSIPDAKQLAEISQLYKNVGDGIDIDTANESLISTLKGFQLEADQAEHIVDVFNEVSNNEAISSGGIGEALQRSAASFNAASTSLEKSVSLVTATNSVLQDPEKVGNMWRTVSARLRGSETELKEMGEDTDGLVTSTSKLQALVKGITGFDIMKDKDTYKDIYDIVLGIGEKWKDLSDIDRASLLEALAGVTTKMFARIYRNINYRIYLIARVA